MIDHNMRKLAIGGSDVAALFGEDEYKDAFDVWAAKKGGLEPEPPNDQMVMGTLLEPAVLHMYEHITKLPITYENITHQHPTRPFQVYSPDALVVGQQRGVEAKVVFWQQRALWGFDGDQEPDIPRRVLMQCYWYMSATEYPQWDVVALLGEGLPRIYTVKRLDPAAEEAMLARVEEWWRRYIMGDERPPMGGSEEAGRWLAKTYPLHKRPDMRDATPDEVKLLDEYLIVRMTQEKIRQQRAALELQIKDAIKDKEGLRWDDCAFTWRRTKDSVKTNWQAMALGLLNQFVKDEQERATLEGLYRYTKDGYRRIHCNHPMLKHNAESENQEVAV